MTYKIIKSKNPYIEKCALNLNGLMVCVQYDIGFKNNRNVIIYNTKNQLLSGFEVVRVVYCATISEANKEFNNILQEWK